MSRREVDAGFSAPVMIAVVLIGVLSFLGLGLASAFSPGSRGADGGGHALSRSAVGFAGLAELLRAVGQPVVMSRGPLSEEESDGMVIVTPPPGGDVASLDENIEPAVTLIVLPKWGVFSHPERRGWVTHHGLLEAAQRAAVLPESLRKDLVLTTRQGVGPTQLRLPDGTPLGRAPKVDRLQTIAAPRCVPTVVDASGRALLCYFEEEFVYVLSDPDLIDNQALKTAEGARAAIGVTRLLIPEGKPVVFDLTLHGYQTSRNLLRQLAQPPFFGAVLCLLAAVGLAGVGAAIRFGPALAAPRAIALGKRALADNTAGLIRLARREHRMALPYARLTRAWTAREVGAPRHLEDKALDAFLDRLGAGRGATHDWSALLARARAAQTPKDLLEVARDLHAWRLEMTRAAQ